MFNAGEIQLTTTSGTVDVWCVDITREIPGGATSGATYTIEPSSYLTTSTPPGLSSTQVGEIGALIAHASGLIGGTNGAAAEAIQLAIWGVEYGWGQYNSATPQFVAAAAVVTDYDTYLTDLATWTPVTNFEALAGTATQQTLACCTSATPTVPEPSTWALLLLGFAGLGAAGWRARGRGAVG